MLSSSADACGRNGRTHRNGVRSIVRERADAARARRGGRGPCCRRSNAVRARAGGMPGAAPDRRAWKQVWKRQATNASCYGYSSARLVAHRMDLAMRLRARASECALGVSPARTAKAFRPGSRGGVHAHFWMMRFPTRFAVTCQAKRRASALSIQSGAPSIFSASAWTTGVQSAASGSAGNARSSARRDRARPQRTDPGGAARGRRSTLKKSCGVAEPTGRSNVAPKVGGIPVMPGVSGH